VLPEDGSDSEIDRLVRLAGEVASEFAWKVEAADVFDARRKRSAGVRSFRSLAIAAFAVVIILLLLVPMPQFHIFPSHGSTRAGGAPQSATSSTLPSLRSDFYPSYLARASSNTAYVVAREMCGGSICLQLLLTSDYGATFERVTPPASQIAANGSFEMTFANPRDGYTVLGPALAHQRLIMTGNSAKSWHLIRFGSTASVYQVAVSKLFAYALVVSCSSKESCSKYRLYRAGVGSSVWVSLAVPSSHDLAGQQIFIASYGDTVWLSIGDGGEVDVLRSTNEGESFSTVSRIPAIGCKLEPTSETVIWLNCDTGNDGAWFRSDDGGHNFGVLPLQGSNVGALDPVSSSIAYFSPVTSRGLYRTIDGGQTFHQESSLSLDVSFGNLMHGLGLVFESQGRTELSRTSDGGSHWEPVRLPKGN